MAEVIKVSNSHQTLPHGYDTRVFQLHLQSSYKVTFLDLSHNEFGEVAGQILGPALGKLLICVRKTQHKQFHNLASAFIASFGSLHAAKISWKDWDEGNLQYHVAMVTGYGNGYTISHQQARVCFSHENMHLLAD